ncbi:hypothetical protein FRC01_007815 [Tulasnella sp. 417]|nr:hypothetical protein FRC01_007815 [Tulasnella sp. 417]
MIGRGYHVRKVRPDRQSVNCGPAEAKEQRTSISDIPEEVLICILEIYLQLNPVNRTSTLCRLRLICRWWEQVIRGAPSFWTNISSFDGTKWTKLASNYSRPLLLKVDIAGLSKNAAIVAIDRELPRAESLSVILPLRSNVQQSPGTFPNLHQAAPDTLKSLSLSASTWYSQHTWLIFGGRWTHLRSLKIAEVNLDWDHCQLSRLERLEITGTEDSHPTLAQLLHVLACCPDLQEVRLVNVGLEVGSNLPSDIITLQKLTTLILRCDTRPVIQILLKTRLPKCRHFELQNEIRSITEPSYPSSLLDALMPIVDTRRVRPSPNNNALYFPEELELVIQCQLESPTLMTGLQFKLHLRDIDTGEELEAFKESDLWRMLEYGGLVIKQSSLGYGAGVARDWALFNA